MNRSTLTGLSFFLLLALTCVFLFIACASSSSDDYGRDDDDDDKQEDGDSNKTDGDNDGNDDEISCIESGCPDGFSCDEESGQCIAKCTVDNDCPNLYLCDKQRGTCFFVGCSNDLDCPDEQHCLRSSGNCVDCSEDLHCSGGICDRENFSCVLSSCSDDAREPNDASGEAVEIAEGSLNKLTICPPDEDWYLFHAKPKDAFSFSIDTTSLISASIINSDSGEVIQSGSGIGQPWIISAPPLNWGGDYWLRLKGLGDAEISYSLQMSTNFSEESTCGDDSLEENDGVSSARQISAKQYNGLRLCPGDPDWYAISLNKGDKLDISLDSEDVAQIAASIMDSDMKLLQSIIGKSAIETEAQSSGTYFVRIAGTGPQVSTIYGMNIKQELAAGSCQDDGFEENDSPLFATESAPGEISGLIACPHDDDWYSFTLIAAQTLKVELKSASDNLDLAIVAPNGSSTLAQGEASSNGSTAEYKTQSAGLYFVRISPLSDADSQQYELAVEIDSPQSNCTDDEYEPNDFYYDSANITEGLYEDLYVCPGDEDWFYLQATSGEELDLQILFEQSMGDLDLYIYEPEGNLIGMSDGTEDDERIQIASLPKTGGYYILVAGYETAENYYMMQIQLTSNVPICENDGFEPNDKAQQAAPISTPFNEDLKVCPGEEDWFAVNLNKGDKLDVYGTILGDTVSFWVDLYNPSGQQQLIMSEQDGKYSDLHFEASENSGMYPIRIKSGSAQAEFEYRLEIEVEKSDTCNDDQYEENDALQTAAALSDGEYQLTICPNDADWFKTELSSGEALYLYLDFNNAALDFDLYLYDPSGKLILSSNSPSQDEEIFLESAQDAGEYSFKITGYGDDSGAYTLNVLSD